MDGPQIKDMEQQNELLNTYRQQQEKYIYYIIALSVAAIGFSIVTTSGKSLKISQIPLGLAVLSSGISIYCGLTFLKYVMSTLYANSALFDVLRGVHPDTGTHPQKIQIGKEAITEAMDKNSRRAEKYAAWQDRLFYFGIICFIAWHVWEMYLSTHN